MHLSLPDAAVQGVVSPAFPQLNGLSTVERGDEHADQWTHVPRQHSHDRSWHEHAHALWCGRNGQSHSHLPHPWSSLDYSWAAWEQPRGDPGQHHGYTSFPVRRHSRFWSSQLVRV